MFRFLKRNSENSGETREVYRDILEAARHETLYRECGVPDTPAGRFQMIVLHAAPVFIRYARQGRAEEAQLLFDLIFRDIELSFREIGVGDLSVPKKMKAYMKDFNGLIQAYADEKADPVQIAGRNVFGEDQKVPDDFSRYIKKLFEG